MGFCFGGEEAYAVRVPPSHCPSHLLGLMQWCCVVCDCCENKRRGEARRGEADADADVRLKVAVIDFLDFLLAASCEMYSR